MVVKFKFLFVALLFAICSGSQVLAEDLPDLEVGVAAYKAENYQAAIHSLLPLAIEGDAEAQYWISRMYFGGKGFGKDHCASTIWAEKAARQNHPYAALDMAFAYDSGYAVRKDSEMAYRWIKYAERLGNPKAHDLINFMARDLSVEARSKIDESMEKWTPADLPRPDYFIIDERVLKPPSFFGKVSIRIGLQGCR